MDSDDQFSMLLAQVADCGSSEDALLALAQRYSYVVPDERSLTVLAGLGPLVEMGAGTGYWAYRLRAVGVDVVAFDQSPPDGEGTNRYHPRSPTWTDVVIGDQSVLAGYSHRALLLCWAPLFSSLGDCLTTYAGNTVAVIGDGGYRTARIRGLNETFTNLTAFPVRAVEPWPGVAPTLSVWSRRPADVRI